MYCHLITQNNGKGHLHPKRKTMPFIWVFNYDDLNRIMWTVSMRGKRRVLLLFVMVLPSLPLGMIALFWLHQNMPGPPPSARLSGRGILGSPPRQNVKQPSIMQHHHGM